MGRHVNDNIEADGATKSTLSLSLSLLSKLFVTPCVIVCDVHRKSGHLSATLSRHVGFSFVSPTGFASLRYVIAGEPNRLEITSGRICAVPNVTPFRPAWRPVASNRVERPGRKKTRSFLCIRNGETATKMRFDRRRYLSTFIGCSFQSSCSTYSQRFLSSDWRGFSARSIWKCDGDDSRSDPVSSSDQKVKATDALDLSAPVCIIQSSSPFDFRSNVWTVCVCVFVAACLALIDWFADRSSKCPIASLGRTSIQTSESIRNSWLLLHIREKKTMFEIMKKNSAAQMWMIHHALRHRYPRADTAPTRSSAERRTRETCVTRWGKILEGGSGGCHLIHLVGATR